MNKEILVTGGNGQLATEYQVSVPTDGWNYNFFGREELDICKLHDIEKAFEQRSFDAVLNLAAYTDVEKAEKEDKEKCFNANALGPKNLAIVCKKYDVPLLHVSTDYVFDGTKKSAYVETDIENPLNHYGRTKFIGEKWVQENHSWYYILRVSWVYSNYSRNFFTNMLNLAQERTELNVVDDQYGSPTSTKEICRAIDAVVKNLSKENSGVYHFSGTGRTTWKDFTDEIFSQAKIAIRVNGVPSTAWKTKVTRPQDTYMSSEKFVRIFDYRPLHWKQALKEIMGERKIVPIKVGDIAVIGSTVHVIVSTDWLIRIAKLSPVDDMKTIIELPFDVLTIS